MTTALGVAPDSSGNGVDPLTHRKVIQYHWENTGVVGGLAVSGRADLKYSVGSGMAVCSRGSSDGYTEAYYGGGTTAAVSSGDPSNPRVDRIWIKAQDPTQGDSGNQVVVGVTQGTPAASPVAPSTPAGCVRLLDMRLPAGATSTQSATVLGTYDYAVPYGVSVGVLADANVSQSYQIPKSDRSNPNWQRRVSVKFTAPTDRMVNIRWKATSCCGGNDSTYIGSYFVQVRLDGTVVSASSNGGSSWIPGNFDEISASRFAETKCVDYDVAVTKGAHTVEAYVLGNPNDDTTAVGLGSVQRVTVTDRGVSR